MAYETGVASSQQDLLSKLSTFAVANGWVQDVFDTVGRQLALHKGTIFVQFKWTANATPGHIGLYQSLAFTGGNAPGTHPNDSGSGDITDPLDADRRINNIGNGPFTAYHFFRGSEYIHVVLEWAPGLYRHFSFGSIVKAGFWTGGEYCSGHVWEPGFTDSLLDNRHSFLFDAINNQAPNSGPTIHLEGFPGQVASGKWGTVWGGTTTNNNDRAGIGRAQIAGGIRDGFWANAIGWLQANPNNGFIPMFPIQAYYRIPTDTPQKFRLMGAMPDVRGINTAFINLGEEFTVAGDTWKVFPWVRKNQLQLGQEGSGNMAVAYKKIV